MYSEPLLKLVCRDVALHYNGVWATSVQFTVCIMCIYKRVHGVLSPVADGFRCKQCDGTIKKLI